MKHARKMARMRHAQSQLYFYKITFINLTYIVTYL